MSMNTDSAQIITWKTALFGREGCHEYWHVMFMAPKAWLSLLDLPIYLGERLWMLTCQCSWEQIML